MTKLLVLQTHPIQYYAPLYQTMSIRDVVDLHVVYLSDAGAQRYEDPGFARQLSWDIPMMEGYVSTVLEPGLPIATKGAVARHSRKLKRTIAEVSPDWLLIFGYASRMNWVAKNWAVRNGVRIAYIGDSSIRNRRNLIKRVLMGPVVRSFFRGIDTFFCTSEANEAYVNQFAPRKTRRVRMPFAIDVRRFSDGAPPPNQDRPFHFVWAGKLVARKRPLDFLSALSNLSATCDRPIKALLVGDGPQREKVHAAVASLPSTVSVEWVGFANQGHMPRLLQSAETLVFTSGTEPYGLIATEAAAAGLALIVSDCIGCVGPEEVARPGENAVTYPSGDVQTLAEAMQDMLLNPEARAKMQARSSVLAADHDLHRAAEIIERCVGQEDSA